MIKLDLKKRATTNEIKHKPAQTAAVELFPSECHLQKLSTATLKNMKSGSIHHMHISAVTQTKAVHAAVMSIMISYDK